MKPIPKRPRKKTLTPGKDKGVFYVYPNEPQATKDASKQESAKRRNEVKLPQSRAAREKIARTEPKHTVFSEEARDAYDEIGKAQMGGRPSNYRPGMCDMAYRYALLGVTNVDIANALCISHETLYQWFKSFPEFSESVARGRLSADSLVAQALYHRAIGTTVPAVKIFMPAKAEKPVYAPYDEHLPGDVTAAIRWLTVRQPERWREIKDMNLKVERVQNPVELKNLTAGQLDALLALAEAKEVTVEVLPESETP